MVERIEGQEVVSQERKLTPEQRTAALFNLGVADLTHALKNRIVGLAGSPKRVRFDVVVPYSKTPVEGEKQIGTNYMRGKEGITIENLDAGDLWAYPLLHRKMKEGGNVRQALIAAKDHDGKSGACVQVLRSSQYNAVTGEFTIMEREGDTSAYFDIDNNEVVQMRFLDDSEALYIVRGTKEDIVDVPAIVTQESEIEVANKYLRDLLG